MPARAGRLSAGGFGLAPGVQTHPPLAFDEHGTPLSTLFGDVFRSRGGALAESRSVFVEGCRLPERWRAQRRVCVVEVGFGLGLNLLATVQALREHAQADARLDYLSIEAYPLSSDDLRAAHRSLGLGDDPLLVALVRAWPMALPGLHRLVLEAGRVGLLIAFGEARRMLPRLNARADAIFLDGFAPQLNPSAWEPRVLRQLARLAAPGARLATYSAAAAVREGLSQAGFEVQRVPGYGPKRERLDAVYAPRWKTWPGPAPPPQWPERHAVIVGAGIAGAAVAARLARQGWRITLVDRSAVAGQGGSAQPAIADHLHLSPDDNRLARLTRAAWLLRNPALEAFGQPIGRLEIARDDADEARHLAIIERLAFPADFVRRVDASEAADIAGCRLPRGALWMPGSRVARPAQRIAAQIASAGILLTWLGGTTIARVQPIDGGYSVIATDGRVVAEAPVVILCEAAGEVDGARIGSLRLRRVRGQTSWVEHPAVSGLRTVLGGAAYAVPVGGRVLTGSTYDELDPIDPDPEADRSNARRLAAMLGLEPTALEALAHPAALGFRWTPADRLPLIGLLPDEVQAEATRDELLRNDRLALPRLQGLYCVRALGSRGLLWSTLGAELIAAWLSGGPMPLESDLLEAIDPARGVRPALRRGGLGGLGASAR